MAIFRFVRKIFRIFWPAGGTPPDGIDCHKWEHKVEILRNLSSKR